MPNNWVDLSQELLEMICNHLISPDYIRMQLVCKSWWLILKKISSRLHELPWLMMLPKDKEEDPDARDFFSLSKQKIFTIRLPEIRGKRCCGSFQNGWLMTVDIDLNISLFHLWSKKTLQLPHQSTFKHQNYVDERGTHTIEEIRDMHISKAALSDDANTVVVIYGLGHTALSRIGDKVWNEIEDSTFMEDVIYHNGQFYSLSQSVCLHLLRIEDGVNPWWEDLTEHLQRPGVFYLVPDIFTDSMFVIIRRMTYMDEKDDEEDEEDEEYSDEEDEEYSDEEDEEYCRSPPSRHITNHFEIYKTPLGEEAPNKELKNKMTKVESMEDRIVFLGYNSSMIFMASEFPGFKGNHIYFADNCMEQYYENPFGCCDSGVFNVEDGTVEQLFIDRFHPMSSPPIWIATPPYSFQRDFGEKLRLELLGEGSDYTGI